jgi:integrase
MTKIASARTPRVERRTNAAGETVTYTYGPRGAARTPPPAKQTLAWLIEQWQRSPQWETPNLTESSRRTYLTYIPYLRDLMDVSFREIDREDIRDLRDFIRKPHDFAGKHRGGPGAALTFVRTVGALFAYAVDEQKLATSPVHKLTKGLDRKDFPEWTREQYQLAIQHLPEHLRRVVVLACWTGQRRSDLIKMTWADYRDGIIETKQLKTGVELKIPVFSALKIELETWRTGSVINLSNSKLPILLDHKGRPFVGSSLSKELGRALQKIPGFPAKRNVHGLRKLAAVMFIEAGCEPLEAMAITGHRDVKTFMAYGKGRNQELLARRAMAKLEAAEAI